MIKSKKFKQIKDLNELGYSNYFISKKLHISKSTVSSYLSKDKIKISRNKIIENYADYIDELLVTHPYSSKVIKKKIEENYNISLSYNTINNYVRDKKKKLNNESTIRFETTPGLQAQCDWGHFTTFKVKDKKGIERSIYCFLLLLGYSRYRYIEFTIDMTTETFIKCHENAFKYFNGIPKEILYDNLKQVVIKRLMKVTESTYNIMFKDFSEYHNFNIILSRPYRGQTKGKVERTVKYVRENFFIDRYYKDLDDLNTQAIEWLNIINNKIIKGTNIIPSNYLKKEKLKPYLKQYDITHYYSRIVRKDCLVTFKTNNYSVPNEYVKRKIYIVEYSNTIFMYCDGKAIASYIICEDRFQTIITKNHYDEISSHSIMNEVNTLLLTKTINQKAKKVKEDIYNVKK